MNEEPIVTNDKFNKKIYFIDNDYTSLMNMQYEELVFKI